MKNFSLYFLALTILLNTLHCEFECNTRALQFYGLEGMNMAIDYKSNVSYDYCPNIKKSCCSNNDFEIAKDLWNEKSKKIKGYLEKMMAIIEKSTSMQSSLTNLANKVRGKNSEFCQKVNFTFFMNKVKFEEIFYYTKVAMQVFGEFQKGFYCAICDYDQNKYLGVERDGNFFNIMSTGFCSKITDLFREFLIYKIYYIDPIIINSNFLFNCYLDTTQYSLKFDYSVTLDEIASCIESQGLETEDCQKLCQEFKIGEASDMFIGSLEQYQNFITNFNEIMENYDRSSVFDEFHINQETNFEHKFFLSENSSDPLLKGADLSNHHTLIEGFGFNLYSASLDSKFGLNGELENVITENFGTDNSTPDHTNVNEKVTEDVFNDPAQDMKFEEAHEQEKLSEIPNQPDKTELENMNNFIDKKETDLEESIRANGEIGGEPGTIEQFEIAKIESSVIFLFLWNIFLLFV